MAMGEKRRFSVMWREYRDCEAVIEADSMEEAEAMIVDEEGELVSAAEMESVVEEMWRSDLFVEGGSEFLDEIVEEEEDDYGA
jgi:hypothetical protein